MKVSRNILKVEMSNYKLLALDEGSRSFHRSLPNYQPTPLHNMTALAKKLGVEKLFIKDESKRFDLNAFKGLGASYAISKSLEKSNTIREVTTATDGNHGRSVAWSAKHFDLKATVFIPDHSAKERIENIKKLNADIVLVAGSYEKATKLASEYSESLAL